MFCNFPQARQKLEKGGAPVQTSCGGHGAQPRALGHGWLRSDAQVVGRDTAWDGAQAEVGGARGVGPEGDKDEQQGADHGGDGDLQLPSLVADTFRQTGMAEANKREKTQRSLTWLHGGVSYE